MDEVVNFAYAKHGQFRGLARVALSDLQYDESHAFAAQNVTRLCRIFHIEGCQRLDERNYIDVLAADTQLDRAAPETLQDSPPQTWEMRPILDVGPLRCLTGQHRIRAAQRCLDANDQWWIARIYSDRLPPSPCLRLAEEYSNEKAPCDGEIFYKIRRYHLANDDTNELKWWARLTETKRKDLRQLLKDVRYAKAFDGMLPWPGLWAPVKLGSLHRLLCLKCDEELLAYLAYISAIWTSITANVDTYDIVDASSVAQLQSLAPQHSTTDAESISDMVAADKIFTRVTDAGQRCTILANLRSIRNMIPSLFTFFEDLKYLEPCAKVLKALLPPRDKLLVEHANSDTRMHNGSSHETVRAFAYQQLWLFAFRNFPLMTNFTTRKVLDKDKPAAVEPSPYVWREFGELAISLGFKTPAAHELCSRDPTRLIVTQLFGRFTEPDSVNDSDAADQIAAILKALHRRREPVGQPTFTSNEQLSVLERCGRPFEDDHSKDRPYLYLPNIYRAPSTGRSITTFYRKCCMFRIFMGIKDTLGQFENDTMIVDAAAGLNHTVQDPRSDGCTEHERIVDSLKSQIERQNQESRETQSEHRRAIESLTRELQAETQRIGGLRRQLQEMEERSNKDSEEKRGLCTELENIRGSMLQTSQQNITVVRGLETQLDQSLRDQDDLRLQITRLEATARELDKGKADSQVMEQGLREQLEKQLHYQQERNTALQSQYSADTLGLNSRIEILEREYTDASAKHRSTVNHMESVLAEKEEQVKSLQQESAQRCLLQETSDKDKQELTEAIQRSTVQAQKDRERISTLESCLREAKVKMTDLESEAMTASEKITILEKELMDARDCIKVQTQVVEQEQDIRYDAEVVVMNQKLENAVAKEVSNKILEELNRANDRGKEMEDKMRTLEANMQCQNSGSDCLLLVTWVRVGASSFNKICFTCSKEDALQCVRSLDLCSKANCDKWDYIGLRQRRIPSSMKQDEKGLVEAWLQNGVMGRWLVADRAFFEGMAQRADMPIWGDRPKISLKRKTPLALTEGEDSRTAKRSQTMGTIEEM